MLQPKNFILLLVNESKEQRNKEKEEEKEKDANRPLEDL